MVANPLAALRSVARRFPWRLALYRVSESTTPPADPVGSLRHLLDNLPPPPIEPEDHDDIDWETGDITKSQTVDMRLGGFDGRPVRLIAPCFGDGETDLYAAFAKA